MLKYIIRRVLVFIPMLLAITAITYVLMVLLPGDPVTALIDPFSLQEGISQEYIDAQREKYGLNKPVPVRYVIWLGQLVRGNFGYSFMTGLPVIEMILGRLVPTLQLTFTALILGTIGGIILGVIAALRQYSYYDYILSFISLIGIAIPTFFLALIALFLVVLKVPLFPSHGWTTELGVYNLWDNLYHLMLPAFILSIELLATSTRFARTAMLEVMSSDYVTTARAKGLSEFWVIGRHAFRNALLPLITISTMRLPILFGGALVIESMFAWPGMGLFAVRAMVNADYPVLMGVAFVTALIVLLSNLLADILYAVADPRIRTGN